MGVFKNKQKKSISCGEAPVLELWRVHCHYFMVHSDPDWVYLLGFLSMAQIDIFENYSYWIGLHEAIVVCKQMIIIIKQNY